MEQVQETQLSAFEERALSELSKVKQNESNAPDYVPKNFVEQFCISNKSLYMWVNNEWVQMTRSHYIGYLSVPSSLGSVSYTGVGFKPAFIKITARCRIGCCSGYATSTSNQKAFPWAVNSTSFHDGTVINYLFGAYDGTFTLESKAELTSFDDDGFTLNWLDKNEPADIIYEVWG